MLKRWLSPLLPLGVGLMLLVLLISHLALPATASAPNPTAPMTDVLTGRTAVTGLINTEYRSVFGPHICTAYGDPFSPFNSPWQPGSYTYRYRIRIPAEYSPDILRVELFDPDSINQATGQATITHTQVAVDASFPATETLSCSSSLLDQKQPCRIDTDEGSLLDTNPSLDLDQINLFWFMRVDENRGAGTAPGNGNCGQPASYDPGYNTQTLFELFYYTDNTDGSSARVDLASYTGQVGDGDRDNGDHQTDLRWISPGGTQLPDQPAPVPADFGSFELDLTQDIPGIVTDSETGARYLYLHVTGLSGGSENGFEIWAGPQYPDVPGDVNARNVHLINNPDSHDSQGVTVSALNYLPTNSNYGGARDIPLLALDPTFGGATVNVSLFDIDSGSSPPLLFYLDSVPESDWSLTFGAGGNDPDGVPSSSRCLPGSCNNQWVSPTYQIQLPTLSTACDLSNLDPQICTPFYGGRLVARYTGGIYDTFAWEVNKPPISLAASPHCTAFPIGIQATARSVTSPGTGTNPYPDAGEFSYPASPPNYDSFRNHRPDVSLADAQEGYVFKFILDTNPSAYNWLVWNTLITADSATLANSLTWPGDSQDYEEQPGGDFRGYQEPDDATDREMDVGDWLAGSTGTISATAVRTAIETHIDLERTLRFPIWTNTTGAGSDARYQIDGFAIFRIHGYSLNEANGPWMVMEFVRWDNACGDPNTQRFYMPAIFNE